MAKQKRNPFDVDESSTENESGDVLAGMYGGVPDGVPDSGRIVAKPISIMSIWPDKTQPRKIIPREIHAGRKINPADMPKILGAWIDGIYDTGVDEIPIEDILLGKHRGSDKDNSLSQNKDPLVKPFVGLLMMAADIRDIGLKQSIEIVETRKDEYRLVLGERRWTAYHLLRMFLGDKYANIPAQISRASAWDIAKAQAAENFHQRQLTAVGVARQLAKLLILARQDTQEPPYDSWDDLVVDGGCDRPYYAQVADGNIHRIPKGMGEEFERTLNISLEQMRQYRGLLRLTDDYDVDNQLWDLGDERDWAERFMRDISELDVLIIRQILSEAEDPEEMFREAVSALRAEKKLQNTVTSGNGIQNATPEEDAPKYPFSGDSTGADSASKPEPAFKYGDEVISPDGPGRIIQSAGNIHLVKLEDGRSIRFGENRLQHKPKSESWFNCYVQNPTGGVGVVIADLVEFCDVEYADGGRGNIHKMYLSEVDKAEFDAAVQRHRNKLEMPVYWINKYVRSPQGVALVTGQMDAQTVRVVFPDGDYMEFAKRLLSFVDKSEWDAAVAARADSDEDEQEKGDDAPVLKFQVDDRVTVQMGMKQVPGTVRYIKPEDKAPYGVFLDHSKTTHYYAEWMLSLLEKATETDWTNAYVRTVTRGVARVTKDIDERYVKLEFPDTDILTAEKRSLIRLKDSEGEQRWNDALFRIHSKGSGSDNANSLPPDGRDESVPGEITPRDWVGKPALIKEDGYKVAVFVKEFIGAGMLKVATSAGQIREVHFSQLEAVASDKTTLSEFFSVDESLDHSDLLGRRVKLTNGETGTVTSIINDRLTIHYTPYMSGGASVGDIVEVLDDDEAEETKAITDVDAQRLLRHIAHITRRETTVLKLLALTKQNAIAAHKAEKLQSNLQSIRDSIKSGFEELLEEVEGLLDGIITDAEETVQE